MKTTFKQTINQFDNSHMTNDQNIIEAFNLDTDKISRNVMHRIHTKQQPKKHSKKLPLLLAAAISTTAVGTGVLAATGAFEQPQTSDEILVGESQILDVYDSGNFTFESPDENLDAHFLGLTGDNDITYALVELTHKDGTPFVEGMNKVYDPVVSSDIRAVGLPIYTSDPSFHPGAFKESSAADKMDDHFGSGTIQIDSLDQYEANMIITDPSDGNKYAHPFSMVYYVMSDDAKTLNIFFRFENTDPPESSVDDADVKRQNSHLSFQFYDRLSKN